MTQKSPQQSSNSAQDPTGRILKITPTLAGTHHVQIDNGPVHTITVVCHSEDLPALLGTDLKAIRDHLMTRRPGHFRKKGAAPTVLTDTVP
jgi:hypothetical protein